MLTWKEVALLLALLAIGGALGLGCAMLLNRAEGRPTPSVPALLRRS